MSGKGQKTRFGRELHAALDSGHLKQSFLSESLGVSTAYVSALVTGKRSAAPGTIDKIAEALSLGEAGRTRMHRAAAMDAGFSLDLPDDY